MDKVWLVTGSASGLGRNIAEAALESGESPRRRLRERFSREHPRRKARVVVLSGEMHRS